MPKIDYKTWRDRVCKLLVINGHVKSESKVAPDIYLPYYEDGYHPEKAVREDLGMNAVRHYIDDQTNHKDETK